jgi:transposase
MGLGGPVSDPHNGRGPQREHSLREVFNGLRWIVRAGAAWRLMPHDLPPWHTVYQQSQRWLKAKVFEAIVHDLREVLRVAQGRNALPSAAIFDSRTLQSTPESGTRAGYDGAKRRRGSKMHMTVDTLYCCSSAGWWSVVMPGQRAVAAWHGMMNSWPRPLLACILWRSLS